MGGKESEGGLKGKGGKGKGVRTGPQIAGSIGDLLKALVFRVHVRSACRLCEASPELVGGAVEALRLYHRHSGDVRVQIAREILPATPAYFVPAAPTIAIP